MTKASDYFPYWKSYFTCGYGEKYQGRMRCGPISIISMFFILVKISSWWATMLPVWRGNFCSGTSWDSCNLTTKNCHKTLEFVSRTLFSRGIPSLTRSTRHNLWGNLEQVFHRHGHLLPNQQHQSTDHPWLWSASERISIVPCTHNNFSNRSLSASGCHAWKWNAAECLAIIPPTRQEL